jgi:hypothetical protein
MRWFDRFDKLTAGRLTILPVLSRVEGSNVEGESRALFAGLPLPDQVEDRLRGRDRVLSLICETRH